MPKFFSKLFVIFLTIASLVYGSITNPDTPDNVRTRSPETNSEQENNESDPDVNISDDYEDSEENTYYPFIYLFNNDPKLQEQCEKDAKHKVKRYYLPNDVEFTEDKMHFATEQFETEIYLCPPEKPQDKQSIAELEKYYWSSKYCLLQKDKDEDKMCKTQPKPLLIKSTEKQSKTNPFQRYQFTYHFCRNGELLKTWLKNKSTCLSCITELFGGPKQVRSSPGGYWRFYNIYYDTNQLRTAYTVHFIMTPRMLQNLEKLPAPKFNTRISTDSYDLQEFGTRFEDTKIAFIQQDEGSPFNFLEEKMVPIEDFAIDTWKKTTLHYINIAALWEPLSLLMYIFNERIRQMAVLVSQKRDQVPGLPKLHFKEGFLIHTTTINLPENENHRTVYLARYKKFPVPDIWVKHVYFVKDKLAIAFYVHNTPQILPESPLCAETIECDFKTWGEQLDPPVIISEEDAKYGYCCKVDSQINDLFHEELPVDNVLDINTLTYNIEIKAIAKDSNKTTRICSTQYDGENLEVKQDDENKLVEWGPNYP